jgi:hypothetical protein
MNEYSFVGRVGIATGYGLDGPGIESRWGSNFPHLSRPALGPTQPPEQWVPGLSREYVRSGRDADPSPLSRAVGHERVEPYLYSPYEPYGLYKASVPVQWCTLPWFVSYCPLNLFATKDPGCKEKFYVIIFLCAFGKLRKATISSVTSVRPCVRMEKVCAN